MVHNLLYPDFYHRVRVWRLILKKKFTCGLSSLCFSFVSGSLLIRFKSVPNSLQVRSLEWTKNGICIGFARELQGRWCFQRKDAETQRFFSNTENTEKRIFLIQKPLPWNGGVVLLIAVNCFGTLRLSVWKSLYIPDGKVCPFFVVLNCFFLFAW